MRKAQYSLEVVLVVSALLFSLMVVLVLQTNVFGTINNEMRAATVTTAIDQVLDASETVYKQGTGATTQVKVKIPANVETSRITGGVVGYTLDEKGKNSTIVKETTIPINGSLPTNEGTYLLTVRSEKDFVNISY